MASLLSENYLEKAIRSTGTGPWLWEVPVRGADIELDFGVWVEPTTEGLRETVTEVVVQAEIDGGGPKTVHRQALRTFGPNQFYRASDSVNPVERTRVYLGAVEREVRLSFHATQLHPAAEPQAVIWGNPTLRAVGPRPPNVVLICVDTLRFDRVIAAQGDRVDVLMPSLRRLSDEGVVFLDAVSQAPWTLPSVASTLTGLPPGIHGAGNLLLTTDDTERAADVTAGLNRGGVKTEQWVESGTSRTYSLLRGEIPTLPEVLAATHDSYLINVRNGWVKAGDLPARFSASHYWVGDDARAPSLGARWLAERAQAPIFLYYHLMNVHEWPGVYLDPQLPPETTRRVYDASVAAEDRIVERILTDLDRLGLYDDSLIVFWADHGEHLSDTGWEGYVGHGQSLSQNLIHVPLIVRWPNGRHRGQKVSGTVRLMDIFATVIDTVAAGASSEVPARVDATHSIGLESIVTGRSTVVAAASEFGAFEAGLHGLQLDGYRVVKRAGALSLLSLKEDRLLDTSQAGWDDRSFRQTARALSAYLEAARQRRPEFRPLELSPEEVSALEALGYLR